MPRATGVDISMLPELESAGVVFRNRNGEKSDAIVVLRESGCDFFRVRLFVNPSPNFQHSHGATQDLAMVRALARRVKSAGGRILLDLHYSDSWADPKRQEKPRAWEHLDFESLERQVEAYTGEVIRDLRESDAAPDMVQVGNEITSGMLFPDGQVADIPTHDEPEQWRKLARLFDAGARGVRAASPTGKPIPVMLHLHGGGQHGLPGYFFDRFTRHSSQFDCIGLSFYPTWGDDLQALKKNLHALAARFGKPIYVVETSYPWRETPPAMTNHAAMHWPRTPEGQTQFLRDLDATLASVPGGLGAGFFWWYPEAVPVQDRFIWRGGSEALFDETGRPLPALLEFGRLGR